MKIEIRKVKKLLRDLCYAVSDLEGVAFETQITKRTFEIQFTKDQVDSYYKLSGPYRADDLMDYLGAKPEQKTELLKALRAWGYYNKVVYAAGLTKRVWLKRIERSSDSKYLYQTFFGIDDEIIKDDGTYTDPP